GSAVETSTNTWSAWQTFLNQVTFSTDAYFNNAPITMFGPNGYITSQSSITATSFWGDGSHLTGIIAGGSVVNSTNTWSAWQTFLNQVTFSTDAYFNNAPITLFGSNGYITSQSSITA